MLDNIVKWVLDRYPHTHGNNTEICIYTWEELAKRKGVNPNSWMEMKAIIREYKPESITRCRRDLVVPTKEQRAEEDRFKDKYRSDGKPETWHTEDV